MKLRTVLVAVAALAAAATAGIALRKPAPAASANAPATQAIEFLPGDVWTVQPVRLTRSLPLTGTLRAADQTTVKTRVAGDLVHLLVREGETVRKGQMSTDVLRDRSAPISCARSARWTGSRAIAS